MLVLIPAYKPDTSLLTLVENLAETAKERGQAVHLLVVDDGSGADYQPIFEQLPRLTSISSTPSLARSFETPGLHNVSVLTQPENLGKGAALRAGLAWAAEYYPAEVTVTADADGQHLPEDILIVGQATNLASSGASLAEQKKLVLGVRTITDPAAPEQKVPLRSRVGNSLTALLFRLSTGANLADTQTGLRGFTPVARDWALTLPGNRYEYEFTMLLRATRFGFGFTQVPITKVYEPGNPSSHFKPVQDSLRIYAPLLGFLAASFSGFIIDTVMLMLLVALGTPLLVAAVGARVSSALGNFALNRLLMHDGAPRPTAGVSLMRYGVLAVLLLGANAGALELLTYLGLPLLVAKVLVELALVPVSFAAQRRWVFADRQALASLAPGSAGRTAGSGYPAAAAPDVRAQQLAAV